MFPQGCFFLLGVLHFLEFMAGLWFVVTPSSRDATRSLRFQVNHRPMLMYSWFPVKLLTSHNRWGNLSRVCIIHCTYSTYTLYTSLLQRSIHFSFMVKYNIFIWHFLRISVFLEWNTALKIHGLLHKSLKELYVVLSFNVSSNKCLMRNHLLKLCLNCVIFTQSLKAYLSG